MNKIKILIYIFISFLFMGCSANIATLNIKNIQKDKKYPLLIHISNDIGQTKFSKVVKFDDVKTKYSSAELFMISEGTHEVKVKWAEIVKDEAIFSFFNNIAIPINYGDFLKPTKEYVIKEKFESGYTYMIDHGDRFRISKVHIPKKLCLLRRKSSTDELQAYNNRTIFNNMEVVSCFEYDGDIKKESIIADWPW